ncbi:MAG: carboxymuconolactone decarboxylase family protein [Gammaproteobacteria bacterium]|nr:MAG: carboxymuconolactone decarboxylase family protein [Gammaproteobacteria bacterium]
MKNYSKRVYSLGLFINDLLYVLLHTFQYIRAYSSGLIPWPMAEKIMLSVTAVNDCRHCARFHSTLALMSGVEEEQVKDLLAMEIKKNVAEDELLALAFAQHYAETERNPDPVRVKELYEFYGKAKTYDIILYLRFILLGNLAGNTLDAFYSRLKGRPAEGINFFSEIIIAAISWPVFTAFAIFSKWRLGKMGIKNPA